MDKKTIDTIVWWIPIKKLRNFICDHINSISNSKTNKVILDSFISV